MPRLLLVIELFECVPENDDVRFVFVAVSVELSCRHNNLKKRLHA